LRAAIERLRSRVRLDRAVDDAAEELKTLRRACNLLELEFATVAAEFATGFAAVAALEAAASDEYAYAGYVSPVSWMRHECHMTGAAASGAIGVGQQREVLPTSIAAMEDGEIGFAHLALMASTASAIGESPTGAGFDEAPLLGQAKQHLVSRFRTDCAHARHAADREGFLAAQLQNEEYRALELKPLEQGGVELHGYFDAVGGSTIRTVLEPLALRNGVGDQRTAQQRLADALVELADHCLNEGLAPRRNGQRPHLQVTATLETIQGLIGAPAGELELGGPIAAATVQRLACDASITRIVLGGESQVLDVGRATRVPSAAMRTALRVRDGGCVWPGCDRPASWTAAHHVLHWGRLGDTNIDNLVSLCRRHHWMVHEGGWNLVRTDDRVLALPPVQRYASLSRPPDSREAA